MERTLILIKPDGVQRGLIGPIIGRLEQRGLKIVGLKMLQMSEELARRHYAIHEGKAFYDRLISYITSAPVVAMVIEGTKVIEVVRTTMGATNPRDAQPGTIRADYSLDVNFNLIHGSDSPENAAKEIGLFFEEPELIRYERAIDPWLIE